MLYKDEGMMRISSDFNKNNYSPNFKKVIMSPVPEKWDQRVLNSVLNSKTIMNIVKEDEKLGETTQIRYYKYISPRYLEIPANDDVYLNVKGKSGEVSLSSHSSYKFIPGSVFENKPEREVSHGPKDISEDLANKINKIDHNHNNSEDLPVNTMDYLKKIASKIIYEPEVPVEPY